MIDAWFAHVKICYSGIPAWILKKLFMYHHVLFHIDLKLLECWVIYMV